MRQAALVLENQKVDTKLAVTQRSGHSVGTEPRPSGALDAVQTSLTSVKNVVCNSKN